MPSGEPGGKGGGLVLGRIDDRHATELLDHNGCGSLNLEFKRVSRIVEFRYGNKTFTHWLSPWLASK
jgi:hypothetical protein